MASQLISFNIGSAAGTAIFIAGLLSVLVIRNYGFGKAFASLGRTINTLKWAMVTISLVLGLGWIMNYSGMSSTLALAAAATGALFPIFSPILGGSGSFSPALTPPPRPWKFVLSSRSQDISAAKAETCGVLHR